MDPDLPLIQGIQAGDDSALDRLIERHREPLFHFVYRTLRDETAARDVVQETFVRVYFHAPKFEPRATVKTWLYAIALNLSRDQARRLAKRLREVPMNAPMAPGAESLEVADSGPLPSETSGQKDRFAFLQKAIDRLPQSLREALILFSIEECSQKETAEILATTPKTVELRVYRAKAKLREWLGSLRDDGKNGPERERANRSGAPKIKS